MSIFELKSENHFVNEYTQMWIEDRILYVVFSKDLYITNEIATKCVDERLKFTKGEDYLMLVDCRTVAGMDKDAIDFFVSDYGTRGIIAAAYIIKSKFQELIGNAIINISRPIFPSKLFKNEDSGLKWLLKFEDL